MPEFAAPLRIVLSPDAKGDILEALRWGRKRFGERAVQRYGDLIKQALRDISHNPERPGSRVAPVYQPGIRTYHLELSRGRARTAFGKVKAPRHYVVYRREGPGLVTVLRVLDDSSDLERQLE